jgi:hypothetical protein
MSGTYLRRDLAISCHKVSQYNYNESSAGAFKRRTVQNEYVVTNVNLAVNHQQNDSTKLFLIGGTSVSIHYEPKYAHKFSA